MLSQPPVPVFLTFCLLVSCLPALSICCFWGHKTPPPSSCWALTTNFHLYFIKVSSNRTKASLSSWLHRSITPHIPHVPCRDPSGCKGLEGVSVAQQLLLLHLIQDVLPKHTGKAELPITHQRKHQVHELFQDVLRELHQAGSQGEENGGMLSWKVENKKEKVDPD